MDPALGSFVHFFTGEDARAWPALVVHVDENDPQLVNLVSWDQNGAHSAALSVPRRNGSGGHGWEWPPQEKANGAEPAAKSGRERRPEELGHERDGHADAGGHDEDAQSDGDFAREGPGPGGPHAVRFPLGK